MLSIIQAAGWPIWPLLLCSVVALALIIERLSSLRSSRILPPRLLEDVLNVSAQQLPAPDMVDRLAENSLLGEVLASGLRAVTAEPQMPEGKLQIPRLQFGAAVQVEGETGSDIEGFCH